MQKRLKTTNKVLDGVDKSLRELQVFIKELEKWIDGNL